MIDKKLEKSISTIIKILKKENLGSIKVSNKLGSIEISNIEENIKYNTQSVVKNVIEDINDVSKATTQISETIESPMVGVIYLSPKPGSPSFIKKGQRIKKGMTICLIEAMKTFNEIKSDKDGIVQNILVKNGNPVEFGQPLIELK